MALVRRESVRSMESVKIYYYLSEAKRRFFYTIEGREEEQEVPFVGSYNEAERQLRCMYPQSIILAR